MGWLSKFFSKGKKVSSSVAERLGFQTPVEELSTGREEEMLNYLAKIILDYGMETPAIMFLESLKPVSVIGSQLFLLPAAPFLEFFGVNGYDYASLFRKRESVERLIKKIEEGVKARE